MMTIFNNETVNNIESQFPKFYHSEVGKLYIHTHFFFGSNQNFHYVTIHSEVGWYIFVSALFAVHCINIDLFFSTTLLQFKLVRQYLRVLVYSYFASRLSLCDTHSV